jgi:hypothetical protein
MPRTHFHSFFILLLMAMTRLAVPAAAAEPAPVATQELLFGNGTAGPFPLMWTAVRFGSEQVTVNQTRLRLVLDYQIDYETGRIAFNQPLRRDQVAQVEYVYDSGRAKANHAPAQVPLALKVWDAGSGTLQMIGAVAPAAVTGSAPTASLLGFQGETALGGGKLSSLFLMSPGAGEAKGSSWQTAALRFGAARETGAFKFHGNLGQAGAGFVPAQQYGLQQGLRVLDFGAAFEPSKRVSFSSQVNRQEALDPGDRAKEQSSIRNQLALAPADGTKLTLTQESASKARPQGKAETLDAIRAQIEQKLGGRTTATALAERRTSDAAGATTTTGVDLASQVTDRAKLTAGFTRRDSEKEGRADSLGLGLQAGRPQGVSLEGSFNRIRAEKTGADTSTQLRLTAQPSKQLGFHAGFQQRVTDRQGDQTGSELGVSAGRNGLVKVERQVVEKVSASGPGEQEERLRVETAPLRGVKFAASKATKQVGNDPARDTRETSLELAPLREFRVAGALREQEVEGGTAHVRSVSGAMKPANFLDLSGAYKTREAPAADAVVTRDVRLALAPVRGLKLQGAYTENPEDKDGRVLDTTNTTLGLESTIGSLVLGGAYTSGAARASAQATEQTEIRLSLNLWGNSRFYSAYKTSEARGGALTQGRTLSLGFTRSLSSSFYLLLEGEMSQVEVNGVSQPGMGDQRAQAKLGLRF